MAKNINNVQDFKYSSAIYGKRKTTKLKYYYV